MKGPKTIKGDYISSFYITIIFACPMSEACSQIILSQTMRNKID
jgi:hypothetical protein